MALAIKNIKSVVPLLDRILVQKVKAAEKTAGGIFLPSSASSSSAPSEAEVLAVGPGLKDKHGKAIATSVAVGDRVLLPQFGGTSLKVGEEEYQLFRDSEILAKLHDL